MHEEVRATEDPSRAILRQASARHDHVHVGVVREGGAPGVKDSDDADAGAQVLGVGAALSVMYGRRPRCKRNLTFPRMVGCGHVFGPAVAATVATGHDVIRGLDPNQGAALMKRMALNGFSQSNGSTVSHHVVFTPAIRERHVYMVYALLHC